MFLAIDVDDPGVAVGLAGVVDEAGRVPVHGGIHHFGVVNAEHVAPDALCREDRGGLAQAGQHSCPSRQLGCEALRELCSLSPPGLTHSRPNHFMPAFTETNLRPCPDHRRE